MLIDSNRRLQETAQRLFMLKQELEEKNRELEIDISKRKKVEASLYKSQQEFDSLFRNCPEALVTELFLLLFCLLKVVLDIVV